MSVNPRRYIAAACLCVGVIVAGCERPPVDTIQRGYRGLGMVEVYNPRTVAALTEANRAPELVAAVPGDGATAGATFKNVKVLGDLSVGEFTRTMVAITNWVSPKEGCTYCHAGNDLASDAVYTKVVARRMFEMTRHINSNYKSHVAGTGVTCFTCHRGQHIPAQTWAIDPGPDRAGGISADPAGQNIAAPQIGLTSLPYDPFSAFLAQKNAIRVVSTTALPAGNRHSIKQTEWTYSLMMHMSQSLGVNCTFCHNSRSFFAWDASTPQRVTAWHGIEMVRELNVAYFEPLRGQLPKNRVGPLGDVLKVNCGTCHNGVYKPLFGANMLKDYPALTVAAGK